MAKPNELEKYGIVDSSSARVIVGLVEGTEEVIASFTSPVKEWSIASLAIMQGKAYGYLANWSATIREGWVKQMVEVRSTYGLGDVYEQRASAAFMRTLKEAVRKDVSDRLLLADSEYKKVRGS